MIANSGPVAILIAEAHPLLRMFTAEALSEAGFETIEVCTAAEALSVLEQNAAMRMLIAGRNIVADSVVLARLVRHRWPKIVIIITSGAGEDLRRVFPLGTRLLRKAYDFKDLVKQVEFVFSKLDEDHSAAPVLPSGVPPHTGTELGNGVGAIAAPTTKPDKT